MADAAGGSGLIGTLYVNFTAQTADLTKNVKDAEKEVVKSAEGMGKAVDLLKSSLAALGIAFGIHEVVSFVKDVINGADELKKFSEELNINIDRLAGFKFAADKANIGDQFQQGMRKFGESVRAARVEGSDMQAVFRDIFKVDPNQADFGKIFEEVADSVGKMENGLNKVGAVQEAFGTRNTRFINLLSGGAAGLNKETQELARVMGVSYEEAATKAGEYNDSLTTLKAAFTGLALTFINKVLPSVIDFNKNFADNLPKYKAVAETIGTGFIQGISAAMLALNSLKAGFQIIAVVILGLVEIQLKFNRMIGQGLADAGEFGINILIKAVNFGARAVNALIDHLPKWIQDRLPGGGGGPVPELEFFKFATPDKLNENIDLVTSMRKDMFEQFQGTQSDIKSNLEGINKEFKIGMEGTVKEIKDGNKKIGDELSKMPVESTDDVKQRQAAHNEALKKFTGLGPKNAIVGEDPRDKLKQDISGLSGISGMSEAVKMREERDGVDKALKEIQKLRNDHIGITTEQENRLTEMEGLYAKKRKAVMLQETTIGLDATSRMFGSLADMSEAFSGKQSGIYMAMFAASKAFAIASATVAIAKGIAEAAGNVWPMNLVAMASVAAATASIVSSIQQTQLVISGGAKAAGGPVSPDQMFLVGEKGPEMFVPNSAGTIISNDRLRGGGGEAPKVVINNYTDAQPVVTEKDDGSGKVVEVMLRKFKNEISSEIRDGRGQIPKALSQTFGLRRGK
jgi:hypothetical protein